MDHEAFDLPGRPVQGHLLDLGLPHDRMGGGHHPLQRDEDTMSFARQVDQGRELRRRDAILRIVHIVSYDDRAGAEGHGKQC